MRVLFFGTAEFAVPSLSALVDSGRHQVLSVVTQPDKPQGRGLRVAFSPVKQAALNLGLPVMQPRRVRTESFLELARALNPDVLALAAFGQIIPQPLLDMPPMGPVNVHGSLLPKYRGAAPIQHAILNGEAVTGITTMWMDATLDTGDILLTRELTIDVDDTAGTLTPKLAALGAELLVETLNRLDSRTCARIPQNHKDATYAPAITASDSVIDWADSARRIRNRVRAMSPRPGAYASFRGRRIKVWTCSVDADSAGISGLVAGVSRESVTVSAGEGHLLLHEIQPENSRRMSAGEWARGARVRPGETFDRET